MAETEVETHLLVRVGPASLGSYKPAPEGTEEAPHTNPNLKSRPPTMMRISISAARAAAAEMEAELFLVDGPLAISPPATAPAWWRTLLFPSTPFPRPDPQPIHVGQPLDAQQSQWLEDQKIRSEPGHFERLAIDRRLVTDCLNHYNSKNLGNEYEPAPGEVTRHYHLHNGICWTHGNFVARRKRSSCFSFLPAPRTFFFFELAVTNGVDGIVTCTPIDEPVTEAYNVWGFPLWWSTRRSGEWDCICKTCYRHYDSPHPGEGKTFTCGHKNVEKVCDMCYRQSEVLHPYPGEFAFGYHHPYHSY